MKFILLMSILLLSINGFTQTENEVTEIKRSPVMNLGATEIPQVELVNIKKNAAGIITSASLKMNVQLMPLGCDVFFLSEEIIASMRKDNPSAENPTRVIDFGTLHPIGVGSAC